MGFKGTKEQWYRQGEMILSGPFNNSTVICVIDGLISQPTTVVEIRDDANAKLMVAAPELLEALIDANNLLKAITEKGEYIEVKSAAFEAINKALNL